MSRVRPRVCLYAVLHLWCLSRRPRAPRPPQATGKRHRQRGRCIIIVTMIIINHTRVIPIYNRVQFPWWWCKSSSSTMTTTAVASAAVPSSSTAPAPGTAASGSQGGQGVVLCPRTLSQVRRSRLRRALTEATAETVNYVKTVGDDDFSLPNPVLYICAYTGCSRLTFALVSSLRCYKCRTDKTYLSFMFIFSWNLLVIVCIKYIYLHNNMYAVWGKRVTSGMPCMRICLA